MTERALATRVGILYLPIVATLLTAIWRRCSGRRMAIALVGVLWNFSALLAVNGIALAVGWWRYPDPVPALSGIPIDGLLGWSVLWGALPVTTTRGIPTFPWLLGLFGLDLLVMGRLQSFVILENPWLIGEFLALGVGLLPSLVLARWLLLRRRLVARAALLAVGFTGLLIGVIPTILLASHGGSWPAISHLRLALGLNLLAIPGVVGLSALQEFVVRGGGTPLPFDSPKRLVTSGWYRYLRNPMQTAGGLLLLGLALVIQEPRLAAASVVAVIFSAGLASWDEAGDLARRGGREWIRYRSAVRNWFPSRKPFQSSQPAILWVGQTCGPCAELGGWIASRKPVGLEIRAAEDHPGQPNRQLEYQAEGAAAEVGIAALARALEHLSLEWVWVGSLMRLPMVAPVLQLLVDASGGGPRDLTDRGYPAVSKQKGETDWSPPNLLSPARIRQPNP